MNDLDKLREKVESLLAYARSLTLTGVDATHKKGVEDAYQNVLNLIDILKGDDV